VSWEFVVEQGGEFEVRVVYACEPGTAGSEYEVVVGERRLRGRVEATDSWTDFRTVTLGRWTLEPGRYTLSVRPLRLQGYAVMNLKKVILQPVKGTEAR
jgi:hypothetical protein